MVSNGVWCSSVIHFFFGRLCLGMEGSRSCHRSYSAAGWKTVTSASIHLVYLDLSPSRCGYFLGPAELFGGFCLVYRVPMVLAVHDVKGRKLLRGFVGPATMQWFGGN